MTANRKNAKKSTGPKTAGGKTKARLNALKHGLRASSLAVPVLEKAEDWEAHRRLTLGSLKPRGYLETVLSERVAALLWRLGRVVRYEREVISIDIEEDGERGKNFMGEETKGLHEYQEEEELYRADHRRVAAMLKKPDHAKVYPFTALSFLDMAAERLGVEESDTDFPFVPEDACWDSWTGWTLAHVKEGAEILIRTSDTPEKTFEELTEEVLRELSYKALRAKLDREKRELVVERRRKNHLLPQEEALNKVNRYETTLERSLFRTLHELQRLQAVRSSGNVPPPVALDVTVSGDS